MKYCKGIVQTVDIAVTLMQKNINFPKLKNNNNNFNGERKIPKNKNAVKFLFNYF